MHTLNMKLTQHIFEVRPKKNIVPDNLEEKKKKKDGRIKKRIDTSNANYVAKPCPHCGSQNHSSSRSLDCPQHTMSSRQILQASLGENFELYTRKRLFENAVRPQYRERLLQGVISLSEYTRSVIIRTQILANQFIILKQGTIPQVCFTQNYFYSLTQIVREKTVTTTNDKLPLEELQSTWQQLKSRHPSLSRPCSTQLTRTSDCITAACMELETSYSNHIVTNFSNRIVAYLRFKITTLFPTLSKSEINSIIDQYAFPRVVGLTEEWPETVEPNFPIIAIVDDICAQLETHVPKPVDSKTLASSPGAYIPALKYMLEEMEKPYEDIRNGKQSNTNVLPRIFSLFPNPSLRWRFVSLNALILVTFFPAMEKVQHPLQYHEVFWKIFDFSVFRIRSAEELRLKNGKIAFNNHIMTDGYSIDFLFARKKPSGEHIRNVELSLEDFNSTEIEQSFQPVAVDPGRKQVFTAAYGTSNGRHEMRRVSRREYDAMTGSTRRTAELRKKKREAGLERLETNMPTPKTASIQQYNSYTTYLLLHLETILAFNNCHSGKLRFQNYQGRQRAREEMVNIFVDGGKKYNPIKRKNTRKNRRRLKKCRKNLEGGHPTQTLPTGRRESSARTTLGRLQGPGPQYWKPSKFEMPSRPPIIAFGNGMLGTKNHIHLNGQPVGVVGVLWKMLKRKERLGKLVAVLIDEYLTSQICNTCNKRSLRKVTTADNISHHSIVVCKNCKILWQRDVNASKNMYQIARSIWAGDHRPTAFARPPPRQPLIAATNAVSSTGSTSR